MVRSQAARSLLQQQKLPLHRIEEGSRDFDDREFGGDEDDRDVETMTRSELIAYVKRGEQGARGRSRGAVGGQRRERDGGERRERGPRKCPNCGKEHAELKCPLPPVDRAARPCWVCHKTGHIGRDCFNKKQIGGLSDERSVGVISPDGALRRLAMVEYAVPKKTAKPIPRQAVLCDFLSKNTFEALSQAERKAYSRADGTSAKARARSGLQRPPSSTQVSDFQSDSASSTISNDVGAIFAVGEARRETEDVVALNIQRCPPRWSLMI